MQWFAHQKIGIVDGCAGDDNPRVIQLVVKSCVNVHQSVESATLRYFDELRRYNYVTPTSYLELLSTFIKLLIEKKEELETTRTRLQNGTMLLPTLKSRVFRVWVL